MKARRRGEPARRRRRRLALLGRLSPSISSLTALAALPGTCCARNRALACPPGPATRLEPFSEQHSPASFASQTLAASRFSGSLSCEQRGQHRLLLELEVATKRCDRLLNDVEPVRRTCRSVRWLLRLHGLLVLDSVPASHPRQDVLFLARLAPRRSSWRPTALAASRSRVQADRPSRRPPGPRRAFGGPTRAPGGGARLGGSSRAVGGRDARRGRRARVRRAAAQVGEGAGSRQCQAGRPAHGLHGAGRRRATSA